MSKRDFGLVGAVVLGVVGAFASCGGGDNSPGTTPEKDASTDTVATDSFVAKDTSPGNDVSTVDSPADSVAPSDAPSDTEPPSDAPVDSPVIDSPVDSPAEAGPTACTTTATGPMRGSAIALSSDDKTVVVVNRDAGSVTVMSVSYADTFPALTLVKELAVGAEPWQVVIDACNARAFVTLRKDQKVVAIEGINTASPTIGASVSVGSEPAALALTPNGTALYVANWVDGTLSVVNPTTMALTSTVDLNGTIAGTGLLGTVTARASLAHPRGIAITNNGDASDADETVYVTEWFAVRTAPENAASLASSDTNWKGLLYKVPLATGSVPSTISLPPVTSTGFNDANGNPTGCFPNQVASVTINGTFGYVSSTCASPVGPTGVFQKGACSLDSQCPTKGLVAGSCVSGACNNTCVLDSDCGVGSAVGACTVATGVCAPLAANAKTTTHPALTVVDLTGATAAVTTTLDTVFTTVAQTLNGTVSARMPLLPTDVDFRPGFAYVSSEGGDALFRLTITAGAITKGGSLTNDFIDLHTSADATIRLPIGMAISKNQGFAFVASDGNRTVEAIDLNTQAVAVGSAGTDFRVLASSALPTGTAASQLNGKRLFNTGLGRWSLSGAAWGSCGACHVDGLTDNVTWYFARGPRQTVSLDGTFNSTDPTDQRVLNWTGILDEVADFEGNVRGISGGVGAIVSTVSTPPANSDRINLFTQTPQQQGLQGSSADVANPAGTSTHPHSVLTNWIDITNWIQTIRSPRAPTNLVAADVAAGQTIFTAPAQGNCIGCHSGGKWTVSKVFYTPGDVPNDAFGSAASTSLSLTSWNANLNSFPSTLFPSTVANAKTFMRSGAPPGFEQIQCVLRPVGTITNTTSAAVPTGVSPAAVHVLELRQDMVTGGQGAGGTNANDFTTGFNPPSLLAMQVGAPYFHAGNARTLEEAFSATFTGHYQTALAQVFSPTATQIQQLVAFLLSIDETTAPVTVPTLGANGGVICHYP